MLFFLLQSTFAQSEDERKNRAVYNRIEFLINTQQADSIYSLAAPSFQQAISREDFINTSEKLFSLGKIQNSELDKFSKGTALYRVSFASTELGLALAIDSTMKFTGLMFQPIEPKQGPKKEAVISQVETKNPLDFFVDSLARSYAEQQNAQSLAIAVIHKNKLNSFFYGETAKGNNTLPDGNTLYEIGSVTKTFTASLLADLVNKGTISLDDTITKFLPDSVAMNPALQKITFKTLANHTSGLPRLADNIDKNPKFNQADPYAVYDRKALFSFLKHVKPTREPEEEFEYSNIGYGLLGELISIISKKPYMQLMKEQLLTPLEMTNTSDKIDPKNKNIAKPYNKNGEEVAYWHFQALTSTGGLKSSLNDLLRYTIAQLTFPETDIQRAMHLTKQFTYFIPPNTDIGLAWRMNMLDDQIYFHHTGATGGFNAFVGFVPDEKAVVIMLANSELSVGELGKKLLEKVLTTK